MYAVLTRASSIYSYMCIANFDTITMDKERRGGGMGGVGVKGIPAMGVRGGAVAAAAERGKKKVWTNVGQNALPAGKPHKMMFSRSLC